MPMRPIASTLFFFLLVVIGLAGCAKRVPVVTEETGEERGTAVATPAPQPRPSIEAPVLGQQQREAEIEERERQVIEESMRRRFGESPRVARELVTQEEFVQQDVHFAFDSFALSDEARAILEKKAAWLAAHPAVTVRIEGHCDERGTQAYNLALGERRAHAVKQYLVALGIDPARLSTISYGEERPLDPRHNEEAWAKNRRAHFVIIGQ